MTVLSITRDAKCKDCCFIKRYSLVRRNGEVSKRNQYICTNSLSGRNHISKEEKVCDHWKL